MCLQTGSPVEKREAISADLFARETGRSTTMDNWICLNFQVRVKGKLYINVRTGLRIYAFVVAFSQKIV